MTLPGGRPKALVEVAGKPLAAYQVGRLATAGVTRVIFACAAEQGSLFESELAGIGPEIVCAEEPERLGRGGGIKFAARLRQESGDVLALNGDELVDVDFAACSRTSCAGALATITLRSRSRSSGSWTSTTTTSSRLPEGGRVSFWVNCGIYVLSEEAIERLPDRGDHETSTLPELVAEGRCARSAMRASG